MKYFALSRFHFWTKWIILQHLLVHFSDGKNKPIKHTKQFISPMKNLCTNVLFNVLSMIHIKKSSLTKVKYTFKHTSNMLEVYILPKYIWSILQIYLKHTSNIYTSIILQVYFNLLNYRRRRSILQVYIISMKTWSIIQVYFKYTLIVLSRSILWVYFRLLQLYFRSILQVYFTKLPWPLFRFDLSQWTNLWIQFNSL